MRSFRTAVFCFLIVGCGTSVNYSPLNAAPHAMHPKRSAEEVEVFTTDKPSRAYVEVGMLEAQRSSDLSLDGAPAVLATLRKEAAHRGCDAILVLGSNDKVVRGVSGPTTLVGYRSTCLVYTAPSAAATTSAPPPVPESPPTSAPTPAGSTATSL